MSTITYLTSLVQQAISRLNNYEANAKKVDELPHQTSLNTNSKIPVSRAGVSEYITVDQIASAIQNGNYNQLLAVGSITVNELTNEIIVASGVSAQINGSIYQTTSDTTIQIRLCPAGFTRKDILVLTTSNTVIAISGEETDGAIVLAPPTPLDAIYITEFDVNDTAIGTPSDPILGAQFKQKTENQSYNYSTTGSNVILPLRGEGQNHYIVDNEDLVSVDGFDKTVLILVRNSEAPYEGKDYLFENKSPNPVQLNHLTSAEIPFSLPNEENLIVPAGGAVWFKYKSDVLVFIMKSWNDPVISKFKGKFTSKANLDAAFPTATDGDYAIVDAGTGSDAIEYIWDNEEGWVLGNSVGASTTDALVEGSTNLYFQTTRVLATALSGLSLLTGGAIVFTDTVLQAFGKLQKQINDLTSGKLDKVTTVDVEKVYIKKADGTQDVKATSNFKDVLEFANFASFPTTGESGKIYVVLDTNVQYRWSGSAYVQIGGDSKIIPLGFIEDSANAQSSTNTLLGYFTIPPNTLQVGDTIIFSSWLKKTTGAGVEPRMTGYIGVSNQLVSDSRTTWGDRVTTTLHQEWFLRSQMFCKTNQIVLRGDTGYMSPGIFYRDINYTLPIYLMAWAHLNVNSATESVKHYGISAYIIKGS